MSRILALFLSCLVAMPALAEPITITQLRDEFTKRGTVALRVAYLDGFPVMTGEMQGFSRIEALEVANTYNAGFKNAAAYAEEKWFGQVVCIRLQQEFRGVERYGMRQIFEWQIELEDFLQDMDEAQTDKLAANVLDSGAD